MSHYITVESGKSLKLKTAGKYCDRDIVVTAEGGSGMVVCEDVNVTKFTPVERLNGLRLRLPNATKIDEDAFRDVHLISIDLPMVTNISVHAFANCDKLQNISAPMVKNIGDSTFILCESLETVSFPTLEVVGSNAFGNCSSLKEVNFPEATYISDLAFSDCPNLIKVDLPKAINIDSGAFLRSTSLQAIILRTTETVCAIDIGAFAIDLDDNGMPTIINDKFYIPSSMYEYYRSAYEPAFEEYGFGGYFDIIFHKIEDYPDICGG